MRCWQGASSLRDRGGLQRGKGLYNGVRAADEKAGGGAQTKDDGGGAQKVRMPRMRGNLSYR
eukprot:1160437-Pelagomonas_calceolata.AAC.5